MKRLIKKAKGYDDYPAGPERNKFVADNEQVLQNAGYSQKRVGMWVKEGDPFYIDDNGGGYDIFCTESPYRECIMYNDTDEETLEWIKSSGPALLENYRARAKKS